MKDQENGIEIITGENAELFVKELGQKITDTGFNALSKNDFYDYVLYLFNKHGSSHFLDTQSNYDNSMLLKITGQKLNTTKQNIFLKYYTQEDKQKILPAFIQKIVNGAIIPELTDDDKFYSFVVEDLPTRSYLEGLMKSTMGKTPDFHLNHEKMRLSVRDFYVLLKNIITEICKNSGEDRKQLQTKIEKMEKDENLRLFIDALIGGSLKAIEKIAPIGAPQLTGFFKNLLSTMVAGRKLKTA
jgi:hypothetical protein